MKKLAFLLALTGLLMVQSVLARPGGGHASSSFDSHSDTGWPDSSNSGLEWSIGGDHYYQDDGSSDSQSPASALLILVIVIFIANAIFSDNQTSIGAYSAAPPDDYRQRRHATVAEQLACIKQIDENFSNILFFDFVHSLYCKFYEFSTKPEYVYLSPFLSTELQHHFDRAQPWTIDEIVVNGIRWLEVNTAGSDGDRLSIEIDANYTLELQGQRSRIAVIERWQFFRRKGLLSAAPEKMQGLRCPECGAPAHFTDAGVCTYCGAAIRQGEAQWCLRQRVVVGTRSVPLGEGLAAYAEEQGTAYATLKAADLIEQKNRLLRRYEISDWQKFWQPLERDVIRAYFMTIYEHWSRRDWQGARHLLSDRLYETDAFWQTLYAERGWYNRLDNLRIEQAELAKIDADKFYEAITVRIFAACNDYTEDDRGKLVGGSKTALRRFSEYWTFVRRTGMEHHDQPYSLSQCPQCGAPADNMGQSGECGYCGSKISTGQFSWVLFLIEQDEVYAG
ncbi:MAG: TIM44-like domain-containing protein [Gammaproteobacteria bacterium]